MSKASLLCKRIKKSLRLYGFHNLIMDVLTVFSACMSIFAAFSRNDIVLGLSCLLLFFLLIIVSISFYLYKKDSVKLDHLYIDNYVISPDGSYKIKKTPLISTITYLILTRHEERKLFNDLSVSSISTDYSFSGDPAHTEFDGNRMPISEQKISYTINSMNRTSHPIFILTSIRFGQFSQKAIIQLTPYLAKMSPVMIFPVNVRMLTFILCVIGSL